MKKNEVRAAILERTEAALSGIGFKRKTAKGIVLRPVEAGWQVIQLPIIDQNPVFRFSFLLCIRIEEVERVLYRFSGIPFQHEVVSWTTMTTLGGLSGNPSFKHQISTPQELESELGTIEALFREQGVPFFEQNQTIQSIESSMNAPSGTLFNSMNLMLRSLVSIFLARMVNNPRFEEIFRHFESEVKHLPEEDRSRLTRLARYLRDKWPSPP